MSKREILKRPLAAILADLPERCYGPPARRDGH